MKFSLHARFAAEFALAQIAAAFVGSPTKRIFIRGTTSRTIVVFIIPQNREPPPTQTGRI